MYETDIQPGTVVQLCTHRDTSRTHRYDARVLPSDRAAKNDAHHRAHLSENASEPLEIMQSHPGHHERLHRTCMAAHDKQTALPRTCPRKCSAQASAALPRSIRPIEHQQRSDSSVPCSFWSFSNGGKVNSACEQVMAQTTLSMTVRSVRKAAEVRVGGMLQCGHSRAWRMLGFGCAYLSVLTAVLCCAWRRDGTGRLACLGPGEAQCRPSESSGYG